MRDRTALFLIFGGVAVIVAAIVWARHVAHEDFENGDAELADATLVDSLLVTLAFQRVVDVDEQPITQWRARVHDARTGRRVFSALGVSWRRCVDDGRQRMWCQREDGGVERVKVPTLEVEPTDEIQQALGLNAVTAKRLATGEVPAANQRQVVLHADQLEILALDTHVQLTAVPIPAMSGERWLVDERILVLTLPPTSSLMAFELTTGQELWRARP